MPLKILWAIAIHWIYEDKPIRGKGKLTKRPNGVVKYPTPFGFHAGQGNREIPLEMDLLYIAKWGIHNIGNFSREGICSADLKRATAGCRENWRGGGDGPFSGVRLDGVLNPMAF